MLHAWQIIRTHLAPGNPRRAHGVNLRQCGITALYLIPIKARVAVKCHWTGLGCHGSRDMGLVATQNRGR